MIKPYFNYTAYKYPGRHMFNGCVWKFLFDPQPKVKICSICCNSIQRRRGQVLDSPLLQIDEHYSLCCHTRQNRFVGDKCLVFWRNSKEPFNDAFFKIHSNLCKIKICTVISLWLIKRAPPPTPQPPLDLLAVTKSRMWSNCSFRGPMCNIYRDL